MDRTVLHDTTTVWSYCDIHARKTMNEEVPGTHGRRIHKHDVNNIGRPYSLLSLGFYGHNPTRHDMVLFVLSAMWIKFFTLSKDQIPFPPARGYNWSNYHTADYMILCKIRICTLTWHEAFQPALPFTQRTRNRTELNWTVFNPHTYVDCKAMRLKTEFGVVWTELNWVEFSMMRNGFWSSNAISRSCPDVIITQQV